MARKKKKENVVISNTPLVPTTIGVIETKESGPIFAIVWILIFVVGIVLLPYITEWVNSGTMPVFNSKPSESEKNPSEEPEAPVEIEYIELKNDSVVTVEKFDFKSFEINKALRTLNLEITNKGGKSTLFKEKNYYIELYTSEKLLLQRIKIASDEIITTQQYSYDISKSFENGDAALIAIIEKEDKDYPQVVLRENVNGAPVLTCSKDSTSLTYEFEKDEEENKLYLVKISESTTYMENTTEDYDMVLQDNTVLNGVFGGISGIKSELVPIRNGFRFNTEVDLKTIIRNNLDRYFNKPTYYLKDTEAKTISFELDASGYSCN